MAKIVINKNFSKNYMFRFMEHSIVPSHNDVETNKGHVYTDVNSPGWYGNYVGFLPDGCQFISVYDDMVNSSNINTNSGACQLLFCNDSFLNIIDKVNTILYDSTYSSIPFHGTTIDVRILLNTILSKNVSCRNNALTFLVNNGVITQTDMDKSLEVLSFMSDFDVSKTNFTYDSENDVWQYRYDLPIKLQTFYNETMNVSAEQLSLVFIPFFTDNFVDYTVTGGWSGQDYNHIGYVSYERLIREHGDSRFFKPYSEFYSTVHQQNVPQITYFSATISEVGQGGDLQFDHTNQIDYFDEIRMKFKIPKEIQ